MALCGSYMFIFSVNKVMKKDAIDFGRWKVNEHEGGAPSPKLQVEWNPCFIRREVAVEKVAA